MIMDEGWAEVQTWGISTPFCYFVISVNCHEVHRYVSNNYQVLSVWVEASIGFHRVSVTEIVQGTKD